MKYILKYQNYFFFFFFLKCKLCIVWNWFITKIILISQNIFVLWLFKMEANKSVPSLNRSQSSNFWWLRSANNVEFTEECVMYIEKRCLDLKKFYKWAELFKENQNSNPDEDRLGRPMTIITPEMMDSVNVLILTELQYRTFLNNWEFLWVKHKKLCMMTLRSIVIEFRQSNERSHTAARTVETLRHFGWLGTAGLQSRAGSLCSIPIPKNFCMEQSFQGKIKGRGGGPHEVIAKMLDCNFEVNKFKLQ